MLLIFPSTTRSEPPGFTPMSPVYSIKFPFSGANSPAALAHETDVMRVCQDGPLRPSMRQCSNNYSCIAPRTPQGAPTRGTMRVLFLVLIVLPESHVGHLSAKTNMAYQYVLRVCIIQANLSYSNLPHTKQDLYMFESITFFHQNNTDTSNPLDIGALVECMLFYGKTSVVANQSTLRQLFLYFGTNRVIELIDEELLNLTYTETGIGVMTRTINGIERHDVGQFSSPQHTYQDELRKICIDVTGKVGKGRRTAQRIQDLIKVRNHENIILEGARKAFSDQDYINYSAKSIISSLIPEKISVDDVVFQTETTDDGIVVATNIDFAALNQIYHKYVPATHSTINSASILSHTLNVESELYFSSNNLSEIATSGLNSSLMSHKINYLLERSTRSSKQIQDFQGFIFDDAKSLKEAINKKQIDLDDLLSVLKHSRKFKKWIMGVEPDQDLIKSYYSEVTKKTMLDHLPGKSVRWGIFTSAGFVADVFATGGVGTAVGIGLGVLDTFYLDKLISGWKPSQFIEDEVKTLLINGA